VQDPRTPAGKSAELLVEPVTGPGNWI
jgi:hypothetical protein